jgi:hypothetical protein
LREKAGNIHRQSLMPGVGARGVEETPDERSKVEQERGNSPVIQLWLTSSSPDLIVVGRTVNLQIAFFD